MEKMQCTVLIPTYNRPNHLKRILSYYYQYGRELAIVVADSGSTENKKKNAQIISSFAEASILHLDQYDLKIDPAHKILDALEHVNTEYCLLCADDDFVTPKGIQESVDFLDQNPDYISAYGNDVWFSFKYDRRGKPKFTYKYYESLVNTQLEAKDRLLRQTTDDHVATYYAVRRTHFMKVFLGEAAKIASGLQFAGALRLTPDLFFAELLILWLPPIYGKMKCLDNLYYVRDDCAPANASRVYITQPDIMNEKSYQPKLLEFTDRIAIHLSKQSGMDLAESRRIVGKAIAVHNRRTPAIVLGVNSMLRKLSLPGWLDLAIRKVYRAGSALIYPPTGSGHSLPARYKNELDQVRLSVLSSAGEVYGPGN
jgi:glycosyltransferase domain-containing protein